MLSTIDCSRNWISHSNQLNIVVEQCDHQFYGRQCNVPSISRRFKIRVDNFRNVSFKRPSLKVSKKCKFCLAGKNSGKWRNNFITVAIIYVCFIDNFSLPLEIRAWNNLLYALTHELPIFRKYLLLKMGSRNEILREVVWRSLKKNFKGGTGEKKFTPPNMTEKCHLGFPRCWVQCKAASRNSTGEGNNVQRQQK